MSDDSKAFTPPASFSARPLPAKVPQLDLAALSLAGGCVPWEYSGASRYHALACAGDEGVAIHDCRRVQDCNEAFARLFGHASCDRLSGQLVSDLLDARACRTLRARGRLPGDQPFEGTGIRQDGSTFAVEILTKPVNYLGRPLAALVVRDVSRRKRREQALRAEALRQKRLAQRNQLVARELSHRMLNSLSAVQALLRLQAGRVADPAARDTVSTIAERVRAMAFVQNRLFEAERAGRPRLQAAEYLRGLSEDLQRGFFGSGHTVATEAPRDLQLTAERASALGMIVTELVINAAKHAFPGGRGGRVEVRVERLRDRLSLSVADDGVGLPPDIDESSRSRSGMRIVRGLAAQLEGTLEIERLQPGTRFLVTFPG